MAKREMLSKDEFMDKLRGMKRAIDVGSQMKLPHDHMYETICKGYDLGGIKTCEILERYAINTHGFDREKISWHKEYVDKLREFGKEFGREKKVLKHKETT